jgi:transcriptional repressor NrdR
MRCPLCGHHKYKLVSIDSEYSDDLIKRRRQCLNPACGHRWNTYEENEINPVKNQHDPPPVGVYPVV